eukprot:TRINITY_DN27919_c0_g1_i1.p1 TRINITY_DN27919_c0_g1~~TRINITY_DN27919_c0_g1_i1.p1  ORF type:complete len:248 (-),score=94.47 TRINITY_DN27919_c0_g1_i1:159-902(-)
MMQDEERNGTDASAVTEEQELTEVTASSPAASNNGLASLKELQEARNRHAQRYKEREEAALRAEREAAEEAERQRQQEEAERLAEKVAEEEREARQRQLEADEEYSRQLAAQLNPGMERQMQEMRNGAVEVPLDDSDSDFASSYHQMEDADGYRAPMRTGYVDRLIDPPAMDMFQALPFPPLLAAEGGGLSVADGDDARDLELQSERGRHRVNNVLKQLVPIGLGLALLTVLLAYLKSNGAHDYDGP